MEDKRKNLRKHIRAASDWLEQADKSIEREEDLRGDLKLMLAKAELQNAEKHQNRSRLTKVLSFATAALIALGIFWLNDEPENISQLTTSTVSTLNSPDKPSLEENPHSTPLPESDTLMGSNTNLNNNTENQSQIPSEQVPTYENSELSQVGNTSEFDLQSDVDPTSQAEDFKSEPIPIFEDVNIISEPVPNLTAESNDKSATSTAPTEDMQKLMQSAGQILRAE